MKRRTINQACIANHVVKYLRAKNIDARRDSRPYSGHITVDMDGVKYSLACNMFREVDVWRMRPNTDPSWPFPYVLDGRFKEIRYRNLYYLAMFLVRDSRSKNSNRLRHQADSAVVTQEVKE